MRPDDFKIFDGLPHGYLILSAVVLGWIVWKVVQLIFWSEKRVERIATQVLASEPVRKSMAAVAEDVFRSLTQHDRETHARIDQQLEDLQIRDGERAASVHRAHQRIDDVQTEVQGIYRLMAEGKR